MNNFKSIGESVTMTGIVSELKSNAAAWQLNTSRQEKIKVQRDTETIFLRSAVRTENSPRKSDDIHESQEAVAAQLFPVTMAWLAETAKLLNGELCRAVFAKLKPGCQVLRHIDEGSYYACRDRYHLVIKSPGGSPMVCGDEELTMREGEFWWFDNKKPHEAFNRSSEERVHLIFDLLPQGDRQSAVRQAEDESRLTPHG